MDFIGTKYILKHFYANVRRQFLATISSSFLTSGSSVKDDIAIGESAFNLGFLKPFGHQIGFCLDLEDRDSVLEAYKVQTGPFFYFGSPPKSFWQPFLLHFWGSDPVSKMMLQVGPKPVPLKTEYWILKTGGWPLFKDPKLARYQLISQFILQNSMFWWIVVYFEDARSNLEMISLQVANSEQNDCKSFVFRHSKL
jgi:hypothetical protein